MRLVFITRPPVGPVQLPVTVTSTFTAADSKARHVRLNLIPSCSGMAEGFSIRFNSGGGTV